MQNIEDTKEVEGHLDLHDRFAQIVVLIGYLTSKLAVLVQTPLGRRVGVEEEEGLRKTSSHFLLTQHLT